MVNIGQEIRLHGIVLLALQVVLTMRNRGQPYRNNLKWVPLAMLLITIEIITLTIL